MAKKRHDRGSNVIDFAQARCRIVRARFIHNAERRHARIQQLHGEEGLSLADAWEKAKSEGLCW